MAIVRKSQFKGRIKISQNDKETDDLQDYIDENQEEYLTCLLGANEYNKLLADLVNDVPQTQKWIDFVQGVTWVDGEGVTHNYKGIEQMLRLFTFYDYVRNQGAKHTSIGIRYANAENSVTPTRQDVNVEIEQRYNDGIELYNAGICWLEYFQKQEFSYDSVTDLGGGQYEFNVVESGLYLSTGDTIVTQKYSFTVDTIGATIVATEVDSTAGLSLESEGTAEYEPFKDLIITTKKWMVFDGML